MSKHSSVKNSKSPRLSTEESDKALFDRIAKKYAQKDLTPSSAIARRAQFLAAWSFLGPPKVETILDVGCGIGAPSAYLKGKYRRYIGLDQSAEEIKLARKLFHWNPKARFLAQNIKAYHGARPDLILSLGALHHMTNLRAVFKTLSSVAKPGACLLVIEPYQGNFFINALRQGRKRLDRSYSADQRYFRETEILKLLQAFNFQHIRIDYQGFLVPFFAQVILPPQFVTRYLSFGAIVFDRLLNRLPLAWKKRLAFNIIIAADFPKE